MRMITLVSGLPRSGTSMMMAMLEAGGMNPLTDDVRRANIDNPNGYYEYDPVMRLAEDSSWLHLANGMVLKVIYRLLYDLPADRQYRIIFMLRDLNEVIKSQSRMLQNRGIESAASDNEMRVLFANELEKVKTWLSEQNHMSVLYVDYRSCIGDPGFCCRQVATFVDTELDIVKMKQVVSPELYRNKNI